MRIHFSRLTKRGPNKLLADKIGQTSAGRGYATNNETVASFTLILSDDSKGEAPEHVLNIDKEGAIVLIRSLAGSLIAFDDDRPGINQGMIMTPKRRGELARDFIGKLLSDWKEESG